MPRTLLTDPLLVATLQRQDWVITRDQAMTMGLTRRAIDHRLSTSRWQRILPDIYLEQQAEPSRQQMLMGAQLYAGPRSAIDARDACRYHGIKAVAVDDSKVYVVEPWGEPARSTGFVVIRRTHAPIRTVTGDFLRFVDAATAVISATRTMTGDRAVLAALSDAVQRHATTHPELVRAHIEASPRGARRTDRAIARLMDGAHSAPEADFLNLVTASTTLPTPRCNARLRLPSGRIVCPDTLFDGAGLVHETNGRVAHARADLFDDMQERHDDMTAAGLTVLHNSPRRITTHGREVIAEVERCYARLNGVGLPQGVTLLSLAS